MSQRCVELLLGRILTDEDFRRSFFPVRDSSFAVAASHGLELTVVERNALSTLQGGRFDFIAQTLDPRISRSGSAGPRATAAPRPAERATEISHEAVGFASLFLAAASLAAQQQEKLPLTLQEATRRALERNTRSPSSGRASPRPTLDHRREGRLRPLLEAAADGGSTPTRSTPLLGRAGGKPRAGERVARRRPRPSRSSCRPAARCQLFYRLGKRHDRQHLHAPLAGVLHRLRRLAAPAAPAEPLDRPGAGSDPRRGGGARRLGGPVSQRRWPTR